MKGEEPTIAYKAVIGINKRVFNNNDIMKRMEIQNKYLRNQNNKI